MRELRWRLALFGAVSFVHAASGEEITAAGRRLGRELDGMGVERLWLSGHYVRWKTGEATDRPVTDGKSHTHCSAFVAATCLKLGIYILRPPDHAESQLANAQCDWLRKEGAKEGWRRVGDAAEAQRLANRGLLVVAAYRERDDKKAGHVAIVRPAVKSAEALAEEGPQIVQAGMTNYESTSLQRGFRHHPAAWRDREVRFYVHEVEWK
jgi:hypothetical protein